MKQTVKTLSPAKSLSSRYNGGLDFWKLVFTFVIVMYHAGEIGEWDNFFPVGATAVEFFFILSGYFMAVSAVKKPPLEAGTLGRETAGFIWHKIISNMIVKKLHSIFFTCFKNAVAHKKWHCYFSYFFCLNQISQTISSTIQCNRFFMKHSSTKMFHF